MRRTTRPRASIWTPRSSRSLGFGTTGSGLRATLDGRAYRSLGEPGRFVIAARVQAGAVFGSDLLETPRDDLFFSGGGGTVRGQPYRSLGLADHARLRAAVPDRRALFPGRIAGGAGQGQRPDRRGGLCRLRAASGWTASPAGSPIRMPGPGWGCATTPGWGRSGSTSPRRSAGPPATACSSTSAWGSRSDVARPAPCRMSGRARPLAQEDDRDYLTAFLEDTLSDAGRQVTVTGFAGALSSQATIERLTIADDQGVWITLTGVVLDWSRSDLFFGRAERQRAVGGRDHHRPAARHRGRRAFARGVGVQPAGPAGVGECRPGGGGPDHACTRSAGSGSDGNAGSLDAAVGRRGAGEVRADPHRGRAAGRHHP